MSSCQIQISEGSVNTPTPPRKPEVNRQRSWMHTQPTWHTPTVRCKSPWRLLTVVKSFSYCPPRLLGRSPAAPCNAAIFEMRIEYNFPGIGTQSICSEDPKPQRSLNAILGSLHSWRRFFRNACARKGPLPSYGGFDLHSTAGWGWWWSRSRSTHQLDCWLRSHACTNQTLRNITSLYFILSIDWWNTHLSMSVWIMNRLLLFPADYFHCC